MKKVRLPFKTSTDALFSKFGNKTYSWNELLSFSQNHMILYSLQHLLN